MRTVGELIEKLKQFDPNKSISNEQNENFRFITKDRYGDVILSPNKPIGKCNRTGADVYPTRIGYKGYVGFCPALDEDLYAMEFTPIK